MSSSLYWLPPPKDRQENSIGFLKHTLCKYLDPEWNGGNFEQTVDASLIPFLTGLIAGYQQSNSEQAKYCISDCESLIAGIQKYGKVELVLHW